MTSGFPEMNTKYIEGNMSGTVPGIDGLRYHHETVEKFAHQPLRVGIICLAFVFLMLHLLHGFASSFQTVGFNNKYSKALKGFTKAFSIVIPMGFVFIALYHYFSTL